MFLQVIVLMSIFHRGRDWYDTCYLLLGRQAGSEQSHAHRRLHQASSGLGADPRSSGDQYDHAPGGADDHQSLRSVRARSGARTARQVRRRGHRADHGAALGRGQPAQGADLRRRSRGAADGSLLRRRRHAGDDLCARHRDPQDRRDLRRAGHRLHRQADDRRRHRPGRPRHRQAARPVAAHLRRQDRHARSRRRAPSRSSGARKAACRCCAPGCPA